MAFSRETRAAAHTHRAKLKAPNVEDVEGDDVPLADFAENIFNRNFAIVQDDGASGRSANAHFVLFRADGESGESFLHEKCRELFSVNFGEDGEQVGESGVGDPHLFAVQNVVFSVGESSARARQFRASDPEDASDNA